MKTGGEDRFGRQAQGCVRTSKSQLKQLTSSMSMASMGEKADFFTRTPPGRFRRDPFRLPRRRDAFVSINHWVRTDRVETVARMAGISHLTAEHPPKAWVGKTTAESSGFHVRSKIFCISWRGCARSARAFGASPRFQARRT